MLLRQFYEDVFRPSRLPLADVQTIYQYDLNIRRFEEFLGHPAKLRDLTDGNIGNCCQWIRADKKLSIASASKLRENLVTIWKLANRRGKLKTFPEIPAIREPKRIPRAWSRDELNLLWDYLCRLPGDISGVPESLWYCSLASVLWDTGERIGALWQTGRSQVDLRGGWIVVRAEVRKGKASDRLFRLSPQSVNLLTKLFELDVRGERVWPWPYCDTYLWQRWKQLLQRAGLPTGREFSFHCLRKSHASHLKARGGDATQSLGHSSDVTTNTIYLDPRITGIGNDPTEKLFRLGDVG